MGGRQSLAGRQDTPDQVDPTQPPKVIVVMPARNAARTLEATFSAIPTDVVDEIILVDDGSTDATLDVARRLPLHLIWHPHTSATEATRRRATWRRSSAVPTSS